MTLRELFKRRRDEFSQMTDDPAARRTPQASRMTELGMPGRVVKLAREAQAVDRSLSPADALAAVFLSQPAVRAEYLGAGLPALPTVVLSDVVLALAKVEQHAEPTLSSADAQRRIYQRHPDLYQRVRDEHTISIGATNRSRRA